MSIPEKLGRAAAELGNAADEAIDLAKTKYEEKVTPEKRAEIKDKFDKGMKVVDEKMTVAADKIEKSIQSFVDGFNSTSGDKK